MRAAERRELILQRLQEQEEPISASALATEFQVSRQIVVGDIALLRAAGEQIEATPRGYVLEKESKGVIRQIACMHQADRTEEELNLCVDYGCVVLNVIVEHPVYGQLTGELKLHSRYDVAQFLEKSKQTKGKALSILTDGVHLHTLQCPSEAAFERVREALAKAGLLLKDE